MRERAILASPLFALILSGCVSGLGAIDSGPRALMANGLISTDFAAGLDQAAKRKALDAEIEALTNGNTGVPVNWSSGKAYSGAVTPGQPFEVSNRICRRYTHVIRGPGIERSSDATACKTNEGIWEPLG